jgi:hypothetical protein
MNRKERRRIMNMSAAQLAREAARMPDPYKAEAERRVKAAQFPSSDDSPIYKEEQRRVRYQGVFEHGTGKRLSQSSHTRMKEAALRHAKKK